MDFFATRGDLLTCFQRDLQQNMKLWVYTVLAKYLTEWGDTASSKSHFMV